MAPSSIPTLFPSLKPSLKPSLVPSLEPSLQPSSAPSLLPSLIPSTLPSAGPTTTAMPSDIPSLPFESAFDGDFCREHKDCRERQLTNVGGLHKSATTLGFCEVDGLCRAQVRLNQQID